MATPTTPQTIINTSTDPALAKSYPTDFTTFPTLTNNAQVYITNITETQIFNSIVTDQAAGVPGEIQFNSGNILAADPGLTYNAATDSLTVGGSLTANAILTDSLFHSNGVPYTFSGNGTIGGSGGQLQYNANGNFAGVPNTSFSTGNLTLGNIANIKILGGVNGTALQTDGTGNLYFAEPYTVIADEFHVATNGNDDDDGSINEPYATIAKALTVVGSGGKVVVHPGSYTENPTIATNNISLVAAQADAGASPLINGTLTISGTVTSTKLQGITANTLNVTTSGTVYATQIKVSNAFNKTGNSYSEFTDSDIMVAGGNVTLSGGNATNTSTTIFVNTKLANVKITNQYTTVFYKDCNFVSNTVMSAGTLIADGTFFYAPTNGGNGITTSGTTTVSLRSSSVFNPNLSIGKINLTSSTYAVSDLIYDKGNSTLGTSAGQISDFQNIRAEDILIDTIIVNEDAGVTGNLTVTGNITVAKVTTSGNISTTANASVTGNLAVSGLATITGNITAANVNTGIVAASGNISGANLSLTTNASVTGNLTAGNVGTGIVNASGNVTGANLVTTGVVAATGNISGANLTLTGLISATGNITGSAITTTGNVTGANLVTAGLVSASGNISGANISASASLAVTANANVGGILAVTGNASTANLTVTGFVSATANLSGANIIAAGVLNATGNVTGANLVTAGVVSAGGNINGISVNASGVVIATGNVTGGNLVTGGVLTATGNITGANLITGGVLTASGNVSGANLNTTGLVSASGNLNGLSVNASGVVIATGNITGGNLITGGLVSATGNVSGSNVTASGNLTVTGLATVTGNITGANLITTGTAFLTTANITNINVLGTSAAANTTATVGNLVTITLNGVTYKLMAV